MNKNIVAGLLFVGVLLGGTLGFLLVEEGWSFLDAFYMTVISVTTVGYGEVHELSSAGRIVAMAVLFCGLGIFGLVVSQITAFVVGGEIGGVFERNRLKRRVANLRDHVIVCGLGKRGSWIASRLAEDSPESVTAVERNADVDAMGELKKKGVVVVNGNARDPDHVESVGMGKASRVVVVAGRDEDNLAIAKEIQKSTQGLPHPPAIIAAVERYETRSYFADRLGEIGISLMGFRSEAALWLAHELMLDWVDSLDRIPAKPLRIFLQATEEFRDEIVRAFAMACQLTAGTRPQFHLFQVTAEAESRFHDSFPAAAHSAEIFWRRESMESTPEDDDILPDFALFALSNDTEGLYAAERYLMRRQSMAPERVIACIQDTGDLKDAAGRPDPFKRPPRVLSFYETRRRSDPILSPAMDAEGRAIHEKYRATAIRKKQDPGPWEKLPEFLRNSNRLAAMHQPVKKRFYTRLTSQGFSAEQILAHLAISEHSRWVAFHVMNGWRPSPEIIPDRRLRAQARLHHSITNFENLDAPTKALDLANVLKALELDMNTQVPGINS
jgi:hypothetical protein